MYINYSTCKINRFQPIYSQKKTQEWLIKGEECLMQCELKGVPTSVLLGFGTRVSIVSEKPVLVNLIDAEIRAISEILDGYDSLRVQWESNSEISFASFTILQLQIGDCEVRTKVDVPFLLVTY